MLDVLTRQMITITQAGGDHQGAREPVAHHLRRAQREDDVHRRRRQLRYGDIVAVIDAAKGAGVEKVGIVTEGMRKAAGGAD
jgi:biopolymer transport protein ExbD